MSVMASQITSLTIVYSAVYSGGLPVYWAVGIAQLTHHSVRGDGINSSTSGLGISAPTLNLVVS